MPVRNRVSSKLDLYHCASSNILFSALSLSCDYSEDKDEDAFEGIDGDVEYMRNEFEPIGDDNDDVSQGAADVMPENMKSKVQ